MIGKKLPRRKVRSGSGGNPFQRQCGLPTAVEKAEPQRLSVVNRLSDSHCRGGIADELNFGKPRPKNIVWKRKK